MTNLNAEPECAGIQTILGAGGVIANELMRELVLRADRVRLVRRHPTPPGPRMEARSADLLDARQVNDAVSGSSVVYLVAGLACRAAVWEAQWPVILRNVIDACKRQGARLVFLDDLTIYGRVEGLISEDTPVNPVSRKGEVRAKLGDMLHREIRAGSLQGLIARGADFYGPGAVNSFLYPMVFELLRDGKHAVWMGNVDMPHSLLFTPDAGRALAALGNGIEAYGQDWLLPVDPIAPTGRELVQAVAQEFDARPGCRILRPWMLRAAGCFHAVPRERLEQLYEHLEPYTVDSRKFRQRFFSATPWREGVRRTVRCMKPPIHP